MRLRRTYEWKDLTIWISPELPLFNFEHLDILCAWIGPPSEKLWSFECSRTSIIQFRASRYIKRLNQTSELNVMTIWIFRELPLFNFERVDISCSWIGPPSQTLWPFEFLESFRCSISWVSIYYAPESDFFLKSYDHLNFSRAFVFLFTASRSIIRLNWTSVLKVMAFWICRQLSLFNLERLDILSAWIGHPFQKLRPFEFLESSGGSI